jgi:hypothetical protein
MWSIVGLVGLFESFSGAALLAFTAVKSESQILHEGTPRIPAVSAHPGDEKFKEAVRNLPHVQALLRQSRVAKCGLWILAIGFLLQFTGALALFICP